MNFLTVIRDAKTSARLQSFVKYANTLHLSRGKSKHLAEMFCVFAAALKEEMGSEIVVETFLEDWHSAVLWSLVFFRPIRLPMHSPLKEFLPNGAQTTSIYEVLACGGGMALTSSGLGVVYDPPNGYLTVIWKEACKSKGVLDGIDGVDCWKRVLADRNKHFKAPNMDAATMRKLADRHTWTVSEARLRKLNYRRDILWHRPGLDWGDFSVFSMNGVDVVHIEAHRQGYLPEVGILPSMLMECVHENVSEKELFRLARRWQQTHHMSEMSEGEREHRLGQMKNYRYARREEANNKETKEYLEATRIVLDISVVVGTNRKARRRRTLTGVEALTLFHRAVSKLALQGIDPPRERRLRSTAFQGRISRLGQLVEIENTGIPKEYKHWVQFQSSTEQLYSYALALDVQHTPPAHEVEMSENIEEL